MHAPRRDFLKLSLGTSTLMWMHPALPLPLFGANRSANPQTGRVLVVVQLSGGNDGLNTVVPYMDDEYYRRRPTIAIRADKVHKIDSDLGFHPQMQGFRRLYDEGLLSVVQSVGYPQPDGDHAVSMKNWQSGRPHEPNCQTGWLGRVVDQRDGSWTDVPAVFVGKTAQPFTLNAAKAVVPSVRSIDQWKLRAAPGSSESAADRKRLETLARLPRQGAGNDLLSHVQHSALTACAGAQRIEAIAATQPSRDADGYPSCQLAQAFRTVAQLIRADLGIRIFCTELGGDGFGGFDNHANQIGNHGALLHQLSGSVAALMDELKRDKLIDRVLLMTFSEFGRTVAENGRRGTDHGSAAPVFLAGGQLAGGLIGPNADFAELENGGLKFHVDFRRVYATVLDRWLGVDCRAVLDERFSPLSPFQA